MLAWDGLGDGMSCETSVAGVGVSNVFSLALSPFSADSYCCALL